MHCCVAPHVAPRQEEQAFGPYRFDLRNERVSLHGTDVMLTGKEFALALLFFNSLHKPLSRRLYHGPDLEIDG